MSIRTEFAKAFGEEQAAAVEQAAESHASETNGERRGDDPFKWAILIAIGFQCMEIERYRLHHGITLDFAAVKKWCVEGANLDSYVGDLDYLALLAGVYDDWMPVVAEGRAS